MRGVRMEDKYGFVYFLTSESMPGLYKIGFTSKHPKARAAEISNSTGCPTPFKVFTYIGCESPREVERHLHKIFAEYRINDKREFFNLEAVQIHEELAWISESFNVDEDSSLYSFVDAKFSLYEKYMHDEQQWKVDYFINQSADASSMDFKRIGFK